jgi:hypothetical protein
MPPTPFTVSQILALADSHHRMTGAWPHGEDRQVHGLRGENWRKLDNALRLGLRGLPGGSSLARLLAEKRGVRNLGQLPRLTQKQILDWADGYHRGTGRWPTSESGAIPGAGGETWKSVDHALRLGSRGLPGDASLARLLAVKRAVRNIQQLPHLTEKQILAWADAHFGRWGDWPTIKCGRVDGAAGETWSGINTALVAGRRGFPGGFSLPRLLARERGLRNPKRPPKLSLTRVLKWAKAYREHHGTWPTRESGPVAEAPGETWAMVDRAMRRATRGFRRRSSLFLLLEKGGQPLKRRRRKKTK